MKFLGETIFLVLIILSLILSGYAVSDDREDGIPIDDKLEEYDKLKRDRNDLFEERNARTKLALQEDNKDIFLDENTNYAIQGSIILGPGADAGDIILIYEGIGNTVISH